MIKILSDSVLLYYIIKNSFRNFQFERVSCKHVPDAGTAKNRRYQRKY